MASLPTGVVTFVLTDLAVSTSAQARTAMAVSTARVRHDEIVARAVSCERGALIESTGERTFSVFRVASDALRAAHRVREAMQDERWPTGVEVRARIGVHTGEATERQGSYSGPSVARLASFAQPNARRRDRGVCSNGRSRAP